MRIIYCTCIFLLFFVNLLAQSPSQNVFIITLDGTRWQEIFKGADESLLRNPAYVRDSTLMLQQFYDDNPAERRRLLMPFFWSVLAKQGQLMGNRDLNSKVDVSNLYRISYAGYSEIFTGFADKIFIPNLAINNRRLNVLQWLNKQSAYEGKVAAFCSWNILPFVLNEKHGTLPVNGGYEMMEGDDSTSALINNVQQTIVSKGNTRHDLLTFECAKNYLRQHHPKIMYLGLGETDEFAHEHAYDTYLQKIHEADAMIAGLWCAVQTDPFYKNNTTFIITTDHGRGNKNSTWSTHGFWVKGSGQTWLAMLGAGIAPDGESNKQQQLYQKQIPATIAALLGVNFTASHSVAAPLPLDKIRTFIQKNVAVKDRYLPYFFPKNYHPVASFNAINRI